MKTNELRIGNYVMYADVICKVEGYSKAFLETNGVNSLISKFQAIPLTEEWLIKLGWKYFNGKTEGTLAMDFEGKLDIDFHEGELKVKSHYEGEQLYRKLYNIKYVHQLQNLYFDLSGEELEYKKQKS